MREAVQQTFRKTFSIPKGILQWYPGHMASGMSKMQRQLKGVDCVVEVHDARIAISGRNPNFVRNLLGVKPHILVLNKSDLIEKADQELIRCKLRTEGIENIIFTNCLEFFKCPGVKKLVPSAIDLISKYPRFNRIEQQDLCMMVIGVPNVGKSSLINALRKNNLMRGNASPVGPKAGVTKSVLTKIKVNVFPSMYLVDTPGILAPNITNDEVGLKLALCACFKDSVPTNYVLADFLLFWLNKIGNFHYVDEFDLGAPQDEILPVLVKIAHDGNYFENKLNVATNSIQQMPNLERAAGAMIDAFRRGKFGLINLDKELLLDN